MTGRLVAAVDLGASSGRVMVGRVAPNELRADRGPPVLRTIQSVFRTGSTGTCWGSTARSSPVYVKRRGPPTASSASGSIRGRSIMGCSTRPDRLLGDPYHYRDGRTAAAVERRPRDHQAGRSLRPDRAPVPAVQHDLPARGGSWLGGVQSRPDDAAHPGSAGLLAARGSVSRRSPTPRRPASWTSIGACGTWR